MKAAMKKTTSLALLFALCLSLAACGASGGADGNAAAPSGGASSSGASSAAEPSKAPAASDGEVYDFIISNCELPTNQFNLAYEDMKEFLESSGRFHVTIYNNQEFSASESECINQVMSNIVQMSQGPTYLVGATAGVEQYYVYDYPFMFEDEAACHKLIDSDIAQRLADQVRENTGLIVGKAWINGWSAMGNSKRDFKTVEDLKGLKLRSAETETTLAFMDELGVAAIPMAFTEIYTAVSQGTIDGVVTPLQFFYQSKFGEVCTHITWDKTMTFVQVPYINASYYESLDAEAQEILMEGMDLFSKNVEEYAADRGQEALELLKSEMNIDVLLPSQETLDQLRAAGEVVQNEHKDIVGEAFFDEVKALLEGSGS